VLRDDLADEITVDLPLPESAAAEIPPDLIFLDPPYKAVTEDPTRAAYLAQRLLDRMAPGGVVCFHFLDGSLDRDDFDAGLKVEIRRWGKSAAALIEKPGVADDSEPEAGLVTDTAYES
jgi:16S rRNA G966 N2-methylase RsmD